jgi:hypothetical protein
MSSLVPNVGKAIISGRMFGTTPTQIEPKWIEWGTGAGAGAAASTTTSTAGAEARTVGTSSMVTTTQTNDTHQVTGTIVATSGKTVTNVGLFDALTTGVLYAIFDGLSVALLTGDGISFTCKVQFT